MSQKNSKDADLIERYSWIREITDQSISARLKMSEFIGLEHELIEIQKALLDSYNRSAPIKHPRDKGDQREEIIRHFLAHYGLIPQKFGISSHRTRVVSPSGHISPELDIVIYDQNETIILKRFDKVLDYFPLDSVHGTIQVKSKLNKKSLLEGLENICSLKRLEPSATLEKSFGHLTLAQGLYRRFGILFAFDSDLEWSKIVSEINGFLAKTETKYIPNMIFILNKGYFIFGSENKYCVNQSDLENLESPKIYGFPDRQGNSLSFFYDILMSMLSKSVTGQPNHLSYMRMPITSGGMSYSYTYGAFAEIGSCPKHGPYVKRISESNLIKILAYINSSSPLLWSEILVPLEGEVKDRSPASGDVYIYNPDKIDIRDILFKDSFTTFESINSDGKMILIPWHYVENEHLIDGCPKC